MLRIEEHRSMYGGKALYTVRDEKGNQVQIPELVRRCNSEHKIRVDVTKKYHLLWDVINKIEKACEEVEHAQG